MKFLPIFEENQNNYKTKDYIKINNTLDETFELILTKMTDYIQLKVIVDVISEKCGSAGFKKIKNLNSLLFVGYRLSENMMIITKGLLEEEIEKTMNNFIYQYNKGYETILDKCDFCGETLEDLSFDKIIFFKCNHIFHRFCFKKEKYDKNICPICDKNDFDISKYEDKVIQKSKQLFDIDVEEKKKKKKDNIKKSDKKKEELKKIRSKKQNLIQLRRIKKKRQDIKSIFDNKFLYNK